MEALVKLLTRSRADLRKYRKLRKYIQLRMNESQRKPFTVIVEGNIGCGKTTFLEHFSRFEKRVEVLTEPVDRWRNANGHNLLELMYKDPER